MSQNRYATISVPRDVKDRLKEGKAPGKDWGEYLTKIYEEWRRFRKIGAFERLLDNLDEEDWRRIEKSHEAFEDGFMIM